MNSSGQNQSEINSDKAATKPRNAETEIRCVYPNERRERNQIYTLLSISNSVNEQEERPFEYANGTGWEDAEPSWERVTPFICCETPKRPKKSRITQPTSSLPHQNTSQSLKKNVSRGTNQQPSAECKFTKGEPITSSRKAGSSCFKPYTYIPKINANPEGERVRGKLDSIQTFLGEKRTLPIKEYEIEYSQQAEQETLSMPKASQGHPPDSLGCLTLNALLVFQPEDGVINLHLEPPPKPKAIVAKRSGKRHGTSTRIVSRSCAAKEAKEKNQTKVDIDHMVKKQIQKSCTAL
ncbi:uncharacterized protein C16orf46 homolog isoform X3 [Thamnophis elegans]|uniref:uncharacterized protein C16orf46 homolog isoform X3 n=1 Tax=Thamnophis elegans TaxID=35005 RepID=UPI0013775C70|nr:uncharacterized protein C16orf46 homolog isoform X3 [Thamnophis elegans]